MAAATNRAMTPYEWALLITLSILWGSSFLFVGVAVSEVYPFTLVTARLILAAIVLYGAIHAMGLGLPHDLLSWRDFVIMGFLNSAVPFCLIAWGQSHIASGLASILISSGVSAGGRRAVAVAGFSSSRTTTSNSGNTS
jgi:drug/metabolite transporter (DMT)-like permease